MVKSELIAQIAKVFPRLPEADVEMGVNQILQCMSDTLANGNRIEIRGFGSFALRHRPPRKAHNPRTGVKVVTVDKFAPHFRPGKLFRERINEARFDNVAIKPEK